MRKIIGIIAGEPNSIASEIIFKSWKSRNKYRHKPFIIIGSIKILSTQMKKLKYKIKINEINRNFNEKNLKKNCLNVYNVEYNQGKAFQKISVKSNKYIFKCFDETLKLLKNKKILGFINCPISKETLFNKKYQGVTEFLSKKSGKNGQETMLIYNKNLSVSPLTTHVPINNVSNHINTLRIVKKAKIINRFYKKVFNTNPKIGILGLNPHNFSPLKSSEEKRKITPAVKKLKKIKINVSGPISPDTSFMNYKKEKLNSIIGMYHDQVLTPFKALFNFSAINITLGLPYYRVSPDHGVGIKIMGKKVANATSLIESIKFFNHIK